MPPLRDTQLLTLSDVLRLIFQARVFVLAGAGIGFVLSLLFLFLLKPQYEIWMIVSPPRQGAEGGTGFLSGETRDPFAPALSPTSAVQDGEYIRFRQSLRGPAVADVLLKMDGMTSFLNDGAMFIFGRHDFEDSREASEHLIENVRLDPIDSSESLRIVYRHPDPTVGVKILKSLVKIDDQLIRLDVKKDVESRIDWLKRELKTTLNPEHRQALTKLLMMEERRKMILSIETPYAVSVIEEATSSPRPVAPKASLLIPFFTLFGMVLAFLVFYARQQFRRDL